MTQTAIQTQIDIIKNASANARKSKESALKFLADAGILKNGKAFQKSRTKQNNKK